MRNLNRRTKRSGAQQFKNSCGSEGCTITLRVLPYGRYDRKRGLATRRVSTLVK